MDTEDHLFVLFRTELKSQLQFAVLAHKALQEAVDGGASDVAIWAYLQAFLLAAANASKLFWGSVKATPDSPDTRKRLMHFAGVDDSSPLKNRRVRNGFEHIDEEMIKWAGGDETNWFVSRSVGPPQVPRHRFGNYDPETGIVTFLDRAAISVPELVEALARIAGRLQAGGS